MKNILLTGAHRSGTTWTGKVIAQAPGIRYVHEPFNLHRGSPVAHWLEYPNGNEREIKNHLRSFYSIWQPNSLYDLKRRITDRTLIKDPIAVMAAEWIYKTFGWQIVVMIRSPLGFVNSLKRKNWRFDFNQLVAQPLLMEKLSHTDKIKEYAAKEPDFIDHAILLWNVIYGMVDEYRKYDWYFLRYEDLCGEFKSLFEYLNLEFSPRAQGYIKNTFTVSPLSLSQQEKEKIVAETEWQKFYSKSELK